MRFISQINMSSFIWYFIIFNVFYSTSCNIDLKMVDIYGPGLNPVEIVMPARYFFVNFTNSFEDKKYFSIKEDDISVSITGRYKKLRDCRIWTNILNRKNNVFIIRYKVYEECNEFKITVKFKGNNIGFSPYVFKESVLPEECYCPKEKIEDWLNTYQCKSMQYNQIYEDLEIFPAVNFTSFRSEALKKFDHPGSMSVCNYVLKNNKVYRKCYGEHVGFKMFIDAILLSLTRKTILPDLEFLVNLGDWPLMKKNNNEKKVFPIFSWCGSNETYDIVMPTYDITESSLECMGRVSLDMLSVQGKIEKEWNEKENKAYWRGRDSSRERLQLIKIARQNPSLFNASLTNFFFFRDLESEYGPKEKHVSFFKFFNYKYQINLDGTVAAYRFPYLLIGNSVIFKQESIYYEHFYRDLREYHHFVPIKRDLSDLINKIEWAVEHDEEVKRISINAQQYAVNNLLPQNIFCYYGFLFYEWSKRIVSPVEVIKNMEHVPQSDQRECNCELLFRNINDEL